MSFKNSIPVFSHLNNSGSALLFPAICGSAAGNSSSLSVDKAPPSVRLAKQVTMVWRSTYAMLLPNMSLMEGQQPLVGSNPPFSK